MKERIAKLFPTKTRDEWCRIMECSDVCFALVLSMEEAPRHPYNRQRGDLCRRERRDPAGAGAAFQPHAERDPAASRQPGEYTEEALRDWGFSASDLERLRACGAIASATRQKSAAA